jgi:hypothetical protein
MEGRGLTLRSKTRRPQISAPKPISGPVPSSNPPGFSNGSAFPPPNREKPQQSGATSDLVKRRYSTRFNQLPDFNANAPPMPGVPKVPEGYGGLTQDSSETRPSTATQQPLRVDVNALRDPSLPAEKCEPHTLRDLCALHDVATNNMRGTKMLPICWPMHQSRISVTTRITSGR